MMRRPPRSTLLPGTTRFRSVSEFPNQLMEPNITGDLKHSVAQPLDLTISQLRDIGWSANPIGDVPFFVRQSDSPTNQCLAIARHWLVGERSEEHTSELQSQS